MVNECEERTLTLELHDTGTEQVAWVSWATRETGRPGDLLRGQAGGKPELVAEVKWLPELDVDKRMKGDMIWFKLALVF